MWLKDQQKKVTKQIYFEILECRIKIQFKSDSHNFESRDK